MFTSSLDADAAGVGGLDLRLDAARSCARFSARTTAHWAARVFDVTERGTFEHGASVLQLPAEDPD